MQNNLKMDIRTAPRSRCRMDSAVRYMRQVADCRIIDISRSGLALELYTAFHAAAGSTVLIENEEIGLLEGMVRWNRGGRLGIQFRQNSNSIAKVAAYFRNFHQEVQPVLKR
ncbi:PilZ domain-containing protein [Agrobacterium vitis]|uniref:PilZ domain-containing protein n=2 Tax=Agrobacterium vitis TaxID=373 RepID=A0ABD6GD26_AGRVI|nr:PilZ domain-containing protein [Agrobacterium vitis]MUO77718.1 PilZ domain-containing protein [Agrobacterium vitis]MUO93235.1 PilZ domain-containing protein [Agrobacterium vitis]MUP04586.1 PilZ domain-containing protein [Agrobacterium vitis]MUZ80977.1 PilZ domain-containing protein [Agrobacterium vitis]MVA08838.1 PilZ domain-containing protein [Agrobacterium vitis]